MNLNPWRFILMVACVGAVLPSAMAQYEVTYSYSGSTVATASTSTTTSTITNLDWATTFANMRSASTFLQPSVFPARSPIVKYTETLKGTITATATWKGSPTAIPASAYFRISSAAAVGWVVNVGTGTAKIDNGLKSKIVNASTNTATKVDQTMAGYKDARYVGAPVITITCDVNISTSVQQSGGVMSGSVGEVFSVTPVNKALAIYAPSPTYQRISAKDPTTGDPIGYAKLSGGNSFQEDQYGNTYGDYGVHYFERSLLTSTWWVCDDFTIDYRGTMMGVWGDDTQVFNTWVSTNPSVTSSDDLVSEIHDLPVDALLDGFVIPSNPATDTVLNTVSWHAKDDSDGFDSTAMYYMTLHPSVQKEEEITRLRYSSYLHEAASGVSGDYPAIMLGSASNDSAVTDTVHVSVTKTTSWKNTTQYSGQLTIDISSLIKAQYGATTTVETSTQYALGNTIDVSLPAHMVVMEWLLPTGVVSHYNESQWGDTGYSGDGSALDIRQVAFSIRPVVASALDLTVPQP